MSNPVIRLSEVVKTFDRHRAIRGLSVDVPEGTVFGLLGRNGAGKTTTLRMIMDIIRPDSGAIRVFGRPMDPPTKDRIGYLPEERGLYPKMTVMDMLQFHGTIKGMRPADARAAAGRWLERLELAEWATRKVEELSKGMQQKAQFVAAAIAEPDLLILDEPFSGMDPVNQDLFKDLILEINRAGTTIVFSTHVMDQAERLCREIALIDGGRSVLDGPLADIKRRFGRNAVQVEWVGDVPPMDSLPWVERVDHYGRYSEVLLRDGADPGQLLEYAAARGEVRRFEVMSPTLHNIFIQQVGRGAADA